jgi:hypothetical protein
LTSLTISSSKICTPSCSSPESNLDCCDKKAEIPEPFPMLLFQHPTPPFALAMIVN